MLLMSSVPWIPAGLLSGTEGQKELPEKQSLRQTGGRTLASPLPARPSLTHASHWLTQLGGWSLMW